MRSALVARAQQQAQASTSTRCALGLPTLRTGRAAMIGFDLAVLSELTSNKDLVHQAFNIRSFQLLDGVTKTATYPGAGLFLAFFLAAGIVAGSAMPLLKGEEANGMTKESKPFEMLGFEFKPEAELKNGRWAMMGLASLWLVEKVLGHALL